MDWNRLFLRMGPLGWILVGCGFASLVAVVDYWTVPQAMVFYLLPVALAARYAGWRAGVAVSLFSSAAWVAVDVTSSPPSVASLHVWNLAWRLGLFVAVSIGLSNLASAQMEVQRLRRYLLDDLREPVSESLQSLQTLRDRALRRDDLYEVELVERGLFGTVRMMELIEAMENPLEPSLDAMPIHTMSISPAQLIDEAIRRIDRSRMPPLGQIDNRGSVGCGAVMADPVLTERVLSSLIRRGLDSSRAVAIVEAQPVAGQSFVSFRVTTSGLTDPSGDVETKIGIGDDASLEFCRHAIEAQGGEVWMESTGRGTRVAFTLPTLRSAV